MTDVGRRVFLAWGLAMLAAATVAWHGRYSADVSFFLPQAPTAEQRLLVDQIREGPAARLLMIAIAGGSADERATLSRALRSRLAGRPELTTLSNGDHALADADREYLFRNRYLLSATVGAERFSVDGLRAAIGESLDLLASSAGLVVKHLLPQDPTGELLGLLGRLDSGSQPPLQSGVWASRDGQRALLLAQTAALGSDIDGQAAAIAGVEAAFAAIREETGLSGARLQLAGPPVFAVRARETVKHEVTRLSTISALCIIALLFVVYCSPRLITFGLLPVISGALAGVAAVSLCFGTVFGVTVGFGSALIGEAIDYSIYYFVQSGDASANWRARFWPTIRLGVLTSVCGFAVLVFSGFPGLAQLGVYALIGLVTAATVTRFVLPSLVATRNLPLGHTRLVDRCTSLAGQLSRLRWLAFVLAFAGALVLAFGRAPLWNSELAALSIADADDLATDAALRADLGAPDSRLLVVVTGDDRESALQAAEKAAQALDRLQAEGIIAGYESPARFLPSAATQLARRDSLPTTAELQPRLLAALADLPLSADKLAPFRRDVESARTAPLLTREAMHGTTLALAVDSLLWPHAGSWSAVLPLHPPTGDSAHGIDEAAVRAALTGSGALFIDFKRELDQLYAHYFAEARTLASGGLAAIVVLLAVTLRSPRRLLAVMAPLLLAVLIVVAGFYLAGVRLQLLHLIGLLLIVAVGSNYALFFDRLGQRLENDGPTLLSLFVACLTTAIGFGTLAFSRVPVLQALGATVAPGAVLALLFAACLTPAKPR